MKTVLAALLGGALLALGSAAHAQGRSDPFEDVDIDCATARNPKGCRERRARLEARQAEVRKACEVKAGQMEREAARETCERKPADERRACYREAVTR